MTEPRRLATGIDARIDAGKEAASVLDTLGYLIHDFNVGIDADNADQIEISMTLSAVENHDPFNQILDEDVDNLGASFALGVTAGMMVADESEDEPGSEGYPANDGKWRDETS